ncbi:MAG: NADP-dependent phosphogluconate dehydrogenase [Bacteroidia bacterium]
MEEQKYDYGMIGLGTMGRNLVYNMSDHGYSVAGFDKDAVQVDAFKKEAGSKNVFATQDLKEFTASLKNPKIIFLLVPAGPIVDIVLSELKPFLSKDDLLLDCGNSHYTDTNTRLDYLMKENIHFMGVGISGGEAGARYGPSIMPGGAKEDYERVAPILEKISAKVNDAPCVKYLGTGSAGHYVKMVHNGIEYGLMQLIGEAYHLLKETGQLNNDELNSIFSKWNEGILRSFLIGITADIFLQKDDLTDNRLIDMICDSAGQKGTGAWTSEDAMALQVPVPVIDMAVSMRDLSALDEERVSANKKLNGDESLVKTKRVELIDELEQALYFAMITTYAQGMSLLHAASKKHTYDLKLDDVAKIWSGGCIIRASLLEDIYTCFNKNPNLSNLMLDETFSKELIKSQQKIRNVIQTAVQSAIPVPALMSSLAYYDALKSKWLPANMIQAQRDYFGAHTYERNDRKGIFHTHWNTNQS